MRIVPFLLSAGVTTALIIALSTRLPVGDTKTPRLGAFLSPQTGFWQNAAPADESFGGEIRLKELQGNADVYFDDRLVPHIYADNERDAYYIQGYLHARFRLWQMEFQTRVAAGRLSEVLGKSLVSTDRFFRRLGMVYAAENSLTAAESDPITKESMDAYTAGVNAYIASLKPHQYPIEYKLLDGIPEPWTNLKTSLFLKFMSFDLAGTEWDFEMANARRLMGATDFEALYPISQTDLDPIIPKGTAFAKPGLSLQVPPDAVGEDWSGSISDSATAFIEPRPHKDNGSNNWAVAGSKTASGRPILANDPHLGLNLPSLWFEMQITTPTMNTYGATFPGSPSVIIGFNDSAAWGFTNAMRDVRDYYEIRFRDSSMQEYWFNNEWRQTSFREERIQVSDSADLVERIAMTVFGPVMYDHHYPNKLHNGKYYACRWKAHDASNELLTFNRLNHARNLDDYKAAIATYQCPGQNMLFVTKTGDIALTQEGEFPAKWRRQGDFPMPGFDSTYMWQGMIPRNENPQMINPARGFVSSANQLPTDTTYPYYLGGAYPPYRGLIINRRLGEMQQITPQDMMALQTDNYNVFAEMARPLLLKYVDETVLQGKEQEYLNLLKQWNLRNDIQENGISVFKAWWDSLEVMVFDDELTAIAAQVPHGRAVRWPEESTLLDGLRSDSTAYRFINNISTPETETLQQIITQALKKATTALTQLENNDRLHWAGNKATSIRHLLRIPGFSRQQLPVGGGEHIINATKDVHGASWRMIVHMTDKIEAWGIYPGGQHGNPHSRFYDNFVDDWAAGRYYPLLFIPREEVANHPNIKWHLTFKKA